MTDVVEDAARASAPLAERLRPTEIADVEQHERLTGPDGALARLNAAQSLGSLICSDIRQMKPRAIDNLARNWVWGKSRRRPGVVPWGNRVKGISATAARGRRRAIGRPIRGSFDGF
jgi:hypothetical protein